MNDRDQSEAGCKNFSVEYYYSGDTLTEVGWLLKKTGKIIIPLIDREILYEQIARKLA
jgi:hypothetical protein